MSPRRAPWLIVLGALACSAPAEPPPGTPVARIAWSSAGERAFAIRLDGEAIGAWRPEAGAWWLVAEAPLAELRSEEHPLRADAPYPQRVSHAAAFVGRDVAFRDEYTRLAPAAPLAIEGLGLVVSDDAPDTNDAEHERLRAWLGAQGLAPTTAPFEALHRAETGRELRVWYEISGRRVDGRFGRVGAPPTARVDSLFRSENGALKIHHKRPGENGRFTYHRKSLELADRIAAGGAPVLEAHQCGCYGYAIASDLTTLGEDLYRVEADWLDDRVGAELFVGLERRAGFPWLGLGDRRRMRDLARRARAWQLSDAQGVPFAELALALPGDPPEGGLGAIGYRFDWIDGETRRPLARAQHDAAEVAIDLYGTDLDGALGELDALLAALPVQVMRGDGVRDSQLAALEQLVDGVRLLREPENEVRLADLASDVDAASAARKVAALLAREPARFAAAAGERPPPPMFGPGAAR
jgi:hypothetical protein